MFHHVFEVLFADVENQLHWNFNAIIAQPCNLGESGVILQVRTSRQLAVGIPGDTLMLCKILVYNYQATCYLPMSYDKFSISLP